MAISAAMVKELRERTGAGMMDCKKALAETDGDMQKAIDYLREKGIARRRRRPGRIAAEGAVTGVSDGGCKGRGQSSRSTVRQTLRRAMSSSVS